MARGDSCVAGCRFVGQEKHPAQCEPRGTISASDPCGCGAPGPHLQGPRCLPPLPHGPGLHPIWLCGFCGRPFPTESSRDAHEALLCRRPKDSPMGESARLPSVRPSLEMLASRVGERLAGVHEAQQRVGARARRLARMAELWREAEAALTAAAATFPGESPALREIREEEARLAVRRAEVVADELERQG